MNTEKHYADGGEPHYRRVARLGLSWCRANITKYAERTKGTPTDDLIKVADYAVMELENHTIATDEQVRKAMAVRNRITALIDKWEPKQRAMERAAQSERQLYRDSGGMAGTSDPAYLGDGSDPVARGYVNQGEPLYAGNQEARLRDSNIARPGRD